MKPTRTHTERVAQRIVKRIVQAVVTYRQRGRYEDVLEEVKGGDWETERFAQLAK